MQKKGKRKESVREFKGGKKGTTRTHRKETSLLRGKEERARKTKGGTIRMLSTRLLAEKSSGVVSGWKGKFTKVVSSLEGGGNPSITCRKSLHRKKSRQCRPGRLKISPKKKTLRRDRYGGRLKKTKKGQKKGFELQLWRIGTPETRGHQASRPKKTWRTYGRMVGKKGGERLRKSCFDLAVGSTNKKRGAFQGGKEHGL